MILRGAIRLAGLLAGLWTGVLLALGALVAPALFATLAPAQAGAIAGRLFAGEAEGAIAIGVLWVIVERARIRHAALARAGSAFSVEFGLALGILFCTVAGYYAVLPMMEAARAGTGRLSFGALHAVSGGFFVLKGLLFLVLAWRSSTANPAIRPTATTS